MKEKIRNLPPKVKKRLQTALLLLCAIATFAVPAFSGGYTVLKEPAITSSAAAIEDVGLLMAASSAYGEAKKSMNSTDNELKETFINNTAALIGSRWQNLGLFLGARDSLSGSVWDAYQDPNGMSSSEVITFNNPTITDAYNKYKAFGYAVQNMNNEAQKSRSTAVSADEGLDAMSSAAIKLGSFGIEFLNDYNPGPVLLALYDSSYLGTYANNKLVKLIRTNEVLYNIVRFFGDPVVTVGGWNMSMFVMLNAVLATVGMALFMLFKVLMGNSTIMDGIVKFITRILIGTVGIFVIANFMSWMLNWVTDTVYEVDESEDTRYVEDNLNIYDWYMTGFQLPSGTTLQIDSLGNFVFSPDIVYSINHYTYNRLIGGATDEAIRARMETLTQYGNKGTASFVIPSSEQDGEGVGWDTDVYYAVLKNYAENKDNLMDGDDDESSPLHKYEGQSFRIYLSKFLWMSSLTMNGSPHGDWTVTGTGSNTTYGLNPISAFNLVRSDFSGETITSTSVVYPPIAYVGFDINDTFVGSAPTHMNSLTRFVACFTLTLAALKGLITIFTAGFGGLISGGVKTATGSANGLGQAIGAVIALLGGVLGISIIMSASLALLDTVYGIAVSLVGDTEVLDGFLGPIVDDVKDIPVIGSWLKNKLTSAVEFILNLVLMFTFPKLGGIPITVFAQAMADLPGKIAERAQMLEAQLLSGRGAAGGGLPPRGGSGQYGRMASGMMGNAFSSGAKQAGRVLGAGAAAAGSIAGAGLATLGRSLNSRADQMEGAGAANPGGFSDKMWDEMSDEQKNDAADFAASQENWNEMSAEEQRAAMEQQGFYSTTTASDSSTQHSSSSSSDNTQYSDEELAAGAAMADAADNTLDDPNRADVPEVSEGQSISAQTPETAEPSADASVEGISESSAADAAAMADASAGSIPDVLGGTDGADGVSGESSDNNNMEQNLNNNQESISQEIKESNEVNLDQDTNAENRMVDASLSSKQGDLSTIEGSASETAPDVQGVPGAQGLNSVYGASTGTASAAGSAATVSASAGKQATGGGLPSSSNAGQRNSSAGQHSGAGATYRSVNQNMQTGGNSMQQTTAVQQNSVSASQSARANNTQVNNSASHNSVSNAGSSQSTTNVGGGSSASHSLTQNNTQAVKDANQGASKQGMNQTGMSRGRYGKQMDIQAQKKARAMHAAGDALQMMGGNRTMAEGIGDALSYVKEAALVAAVPEELQTSEFMNGLRMRRIERLQRQQMRNNRKQ